MYDEFVRRNPTFEDRIDALTSGMLTPDMKALALWAMERDKFYTRSTLYTAAERFAGRRLPSSSKNVWQYCHGNLYRGHEGSLYSIGAVVKDTTVDTGSGSMIAYGKTDAGADFGDALAALACMAVNRLDGDAQRSRYVTMNRILGAPYKSMPAAHRHGYAIYKVVKLLVENPDKDFRVTDFIAHTELNDTTLGYALNILGNFGVISYYSPYRDVHGKRASGWAVVKVKREICEADFDDIYERAIGTRKFYKKYLNLVLEFCKNHVHEELDYTKIAKSLGIDKSAVSKCIRVLRDFGYLEGEIKGGEKISSAMCTPHTIRLWQDLFTDVERIAMDMKVYPELGRALRIYEEDESLRLDHVRRWMDLYEAESTRLGHRHNILKQRILKKLTRDRIKLSVVLELLRDEGFEGSRQNVSSILKNLKRSGKVVSDRKGYYRLA